MGLIFTFFFLSAISAILSVKIPVKESSKCWLVAWTWKNVWMPLRDFLLRKVTSNRVIYTYFSVMGAINGPCIIFNVFKVQTENFFIEFSVEPINIIVLIVDGLLTIVALVHLSLQFFNKDKVCIEDTTSSVLDIIKNQCDEIKELIPLYKESIEKLHLKDAYKHLVSIRTIVCKRRATDFELLATIDYLKGKCSRYIKGNDEEKEFSLAYEEMKKSNRMFVEIVEEYIYVNLTDGDKQHISDLCNQVLEKYPDNAIANAAKVVWSEDVEQTYKEMSEDIKTNIEFQYVIFDYIFRHPEHQWLNIESIQIVIPEVLSYENLRQWSLAMSISFTLLLREGHFFYDGRKVTPRLKSVYDITSKYKRLSIGSDIENIFLDVDFMYLYSEFMLTDNVGKRNSIIASMKECKPTQGNKVSYVVLLLEMLLVNKNFEEAAIVLEKYKDINDETLALVWFILPTRIINSKYAVNAFEHLEKRNILLPDIHCQPVLSCVAIYAEHIKQFKDLKIFENTITQEIYEYSIFYFTTKSCDVDTIETLAKKSPKEAKFILAMILGKEEHIEEALAIIRPLVNEVAYSIEVGVFLSIIRGRNDYNDITFETLKRLRKSGITHVKELLEEEYHLAVACSDLKDVGEVICLLFKKYPENNSVFVNYLQYLNCTQQNDIFSKYVDRILKITDKNDNHIIRLFNLLILQGYYKEGLDFLYEAIVRTKSQTLKDLWVESLYTPHISPIINEEKQIVENGDVVVYEENGQVKSEDIFINSNTEKLIGCKVGDKVCLDRFGIVSYAKINNIYNKYHSLTKQIYQEIQQGKSKNVRMFTLEDLKVGNGNMFTNLMMLSGGADNKRLIDNWERQYAKRETMLIGILGEHDAYEQCVNRIFGTERIYCLPFQNYEKCPIGDYECVLDITSVVLLSMLNRIFGITFNQKFVIPQGLLLYLQQTLQREKIKTPSFITRDIVDKLKFDEEHHENYHVEILQYILEWIDKNCIAEVATKMLNLRFPDSKHSFFDIECESMLLTIDKKRCMISEDWGLINKWENFKILNTEAFIYLLDDKQKVNVSKFLADSHFVGVNVDLNYMLEQYNKKNKQQVNAFEDCIEALGVNSYLIKAGLTLANRILYSTIRLPGDSIVVMKIFDKIIDGQSNEFRKDLIMQLKKQNGLHPDFIPYLMDTIKAKRILLV